ncbi:Multidrug efflux pump subunit AcrB [Chitinophaga terrae (ex Kim and Jung 2007)]|uniref:Multidrug efflux pump subunit AcrB n=1 Tax=Chitinophaga terrae (ex Kim and Jung 2007) TaxID=408074 RepID=A0A1H3Y074_9BACT|nr:efflux RND transporter permease subunit [Chitinophaga terrae (ex Kim and Jung 2007)]MDQ0108085.1 multidrug efflux pump subunit AcrB [Chitinophaga terrae (ex Kim and Jung 2007)]GEP89509.1 copper transporter [Chitinophaga terrae (ex Kim and Jung 2007)]SEA05006.1 Multidrug efflux pump subunit AcrB [Chitinophaga terrae (ex Kim and Jung 2007)]
MQDNLKKEFKPTSWAIDNKISIYVATIIVALAGIMSYISLPKEQFPEVVFPQFYISTINAGTSPEDMETTVTKPIEKQLNGISGVKKIKSTSMQDFSSIIIEFNANEDIEAARQQVREKVDDAKKDLPNDLTQEPQIVKVDVSQIPIMNVNLSGDFDLQTLKKYADDMKDRIEALNEITRVDLVGELEREIQINVDKYKMDAAKISFEDILMAIQNENITISGGQVSMDGQKRTLSVKGEYKDPSRIGNIIVRGQSGATVYLRDVANVVDGFLEQESYARLGGKNVITLNVIKQSGKNLIDASDKIQEIKKDMQENYFPKDLNVTITADQSKSTRVTLHDLINTIIIGFILVTVILMFFMGAVNAIFVALSVPISMFIAFLLMPMYGFTLNMMVLFSFLLALGIVVDDAIVVIENVHRIFNERKELGIVKAAKVAAGEVFLPVFSGTLTVLAPFFPLLFWPGVIGKFMFYLPVTLITTLGASLVVAYIINPVFAVDFMDQHEGEEHAKPKFDKKFKILTAVFALIALIGYANGSMGVGNFVVFVYLMILLERFWLGGVARRFQTKFWPKVQERYKQILKWCLIGWRPVWIVIATFGLLVFSIMLTVIRSPKVVFFPQADPNFIYTYIELPNGTDQKYTDSITAIVEKRITNVVGANNPIVESIISNVAKNAGDPSQMDMSTQPQKGKVTVAFVEFGARNGQSTVQYLDKIRQAVKGIPGTNITVEQEQGGPPTGKPINIEISGDNFDELTSTSFNLKRYLDSLHIGGVEELKSDFEANKPEIVVNIDRERANAQGISTKQIGQTLRAALFGIEASKIRDAKDEYKIMVRLREDQRNNIENLMNLNLVYRDMNMGGIIRQVPLSSVADISYSNTYAGIKRIDQKRVITLYSNVLTGFNANEVVQHIQDAVNNFSHPSSVTIKMTGEQEDQQETANFLVMAMLGAFGLILMIMVTQFNSIGRPLVIFMEIIFSIIGVFLGFAIFKMDISIVMTGVGIMALAGIVVRNGIVLVEFTDLLIQQKMPVYDAVVEAGKTRMTPVLLTAIAAILGLIPLAVGFNIDFASLFSHFNPHIFFGGDNVAFWGPLAWTMVFGLVFATFLTLILVPVMYAMNKRSIDVLDRYKAPRWLKYVPFAALIMKLLLSKEEVRKLHDPKYVSPRPYNFFPEPEKDDETEVIHKSVKGISVN